MRVRENLRTVRAKDRLLSGTDFKHVSRAKVRTSREKATELSSNTKHPREPNKTQTNFKASEIPKEIRTSIIENFAEAKNSINPEQPS